MTDTRSSFRKHAKLVVALLSASALGLLIGCGGSGGSSLGGTSSTSLTGTTTSTATTSTTSSTGSTTIPTGTLPSNVIFYVDGQVQQVGTNFANYDLYYVSPDGTGKALYVTVPANVAAASANPSVQNQFVFAATSDGTNYNIYSNTSLSTSGAKTIVSANLVDVDAIAVSPDGTSVYYSALDADSFEAIFKVPLAGGTPIELFHGDDPEVDPTNTYLTFDQLDPTQTVSYIFMSKVDGTGVKQLTSGSSANDALPQWSKPTSSTPVPNMVAFDRSTQNDCQICTVNVSTLAVNQLTTNPVDTAQNNTTVYVLNTGPSFSPDNSNVSFYSTPVSLGGDPLAQPGLFVVPSSASMQAPDTQLTAIAPIGVVEGGLETYWTGTSGRSATAGRFFEFRRKHSKRLAINPKK